MFGVDLKAEEEYTHLLDIPRLAWLLFDSAKRHLVCQLISQVTFRTSKIVKYFISFDCLQAITKIMLHPENSALVLTAAMDGIVKVNSLDFMEELYRYSKALFPRK